MNTDTYTNDAIRAISEINREDNSRDLAIVSQAKTTVSLRTLEVTARQLGLQVFFEELNCEDGQPHMHMLVSRGLEGYIALDMIAECKRGDIARNTLQLKLGQMLGYDSSSIQEFLTTDLSATCPCDCCGGAPKVVFKGQRGSMWITAEVVEKVDGGYILNCGDTEDFFVEDTYVKQAAPVTMQPIAVPSINIYQQ